MYEPHGGNRQRTFTWGCSGCQCHGHRHGWLCSEFLSGKKEKKIPQACPPLGVSWGYPRGEELSEMETVFVVVVVFLGGAMVIRKATPTASKFTSDHTIPVLIVAWYLGCQNRHIIRCWGYVLLLYGEVADTNVALDDVRGHPLDYYMYSSVDSRPLSMRKEVKIENIPCELETGEAPTSNSELECGWQEMYLH